MNQYRVVYVEPGKPAVEKKIGTKLEDLQAEVTQHYALPFFSSFFSASRIY